MDVERVGWRDRNEAGWRLAGLLASLMKQFSERKWCGTPATDQQDDFWPIFESFPGGRRW